MLRRTALVKSYVSEERNAIIIKVTRISELGTTTGNIATLIVAAIRSSKTYVLTRAIRRNILEDGIRHCHRRENLKSYIALSGWK
jgi:hypothetical protein